MNQMDEDAFWALLEEARADAAYVDDLPDALTDLLVERPQEQVLAAKITYEKLSAAANRRDLWGAAYVAMGGCSDDAFDYFRAWLVGAGRRVYELVLAEPDQLAGVLVDDDEELELESLAYSFDAAWEELTGDELIPEELLVDAPGYQEPAGEPWDFEDDEEMARRYPRLWARLHA